MKLETLKSKLSEASKRANNNNAKRYIDSVVEKFNNTNEKISAEYPGEVHNFGWCEIDVFDAVTGRRIETIKILLP